MNRKMNLFLITTVILSTLVVFSCAEIQKPESIQKSIITTGGSFSNAPYSPGVLVGNTLYCSGRIGTDPETGELGEAIGEQTRLTLESINQILKEAGFEMSDVVSVSVFLVNLDDYAGMNEVYKTFFPVDPPARATVAVAGLVKEALIEISCIAVKTE